MKTTNEYCDFCRKLTTDAGKKLHTLHGFTVTLGYSLGGWGRRENFLFPQSAEICSGCFAKVQAKSKEMAATIESCKSARYSEAELLELDRLDQKPVPSIARRIADWIDSKLAK